MYGQLSIWTIVHDGQLIVHAWTIVHGPLWTIVHTMDNCPLSMSMYTYVQVRKLGPRGPIRPLLGLKQPFLGPIMIRWSQMAKRR